MHIVDLVAKLGIKIVANLIAFYVISLKRIQEMLIAINAKGISLEKKVLKNADVLKTNLVKEEAICVHLVEVLKNLLIKMKVIANPVSTKKENYVPNLQNKHLKMLLGKLLGNVFLKEFWLKNHARFVAIQRWKRIMMTTTKLYRLDGYAESTTKSTTKTFYVEQFN